jgi:hypothetical protein
MAAKKNKKKTIRKPKKLGTVRALTVRKAC